MLQFKEQMPLFFVKRMVALLHSKAAALVVPVMVVEMVVSEGPAIMGVGVVELEGIPRKVVPVV
jgi:hypothetical protein